jgi:hypothetical protein
VTEAEAYLVLEVHPAARPEVVRAAIDCLRDICLREDGADAPRRLAELNRAFRTVGARAGAASQ